MSEQVVKLEGIELPLPASPSAEVVLHGDMRSFLIYSTYYASHFIVSLKENVFEAICDELKLVGIFENHSLALQEAATKIGLN